MIDACLVLPCHGFCTRSLELKERPAVEDDGLQLAVEYAIAYHHAHEKHDQHRQGGKTSRCPGQDVAALGTPRKADSGGPNGQQPLSRGAEPEAEPEMAGNRNGPTRGESVQPWRRCGGDRLRRSRESQACQIRRWSTGHVGAGREPCALLRTFLIAIAEGRNQSFQLPGLPLVCYFNGASSQPGRLPRSRSVAHGSTRPSAKPLLVPESDIFITCSWKPVTRTGHCTR